MLKLTKIFRRSPSEIVQEDPKSKVVDRIWQRVEHAKKGVELARKIKPNELKGWSTKPMAIEEGTIGLFFSDGALVGSLQPGRHDQGGALMKLGLMDFGHVEHVVCVEQGDFYLEFGYEDLDTSRDKTIMSSKDPVLLADIDARLFLNISDPSMFFTQVMKGKSVVYAQDVADLIEKEVNDVIRDSMHKTNYADLLRNLEAKHNLERQLISELNTHLTHLGLTLIRTSAFSFYSKQYAEMQQHDQKAAALAYQMEVVSRQRKMEYADEVSQLQDKLETSQAKAKLETTDESERSKLEAEQLQIRDELEKVKERLYKDKYIRREDIEELEHMGEMNKQNRDQELAKLMLTNERDVLELKIQTDKSVKDARLKVMVDHISKEHSRDEGLADAELRKKIRTMELEGDIDVAIADKEEMLMLLDVKKVKDEQKMWLKKQEHELEIEMKSVINEHELAILKVEKEAEVEIAGLKAGADTEAEERILAEKEKQLKYMQDTQATFARFVEKGFDAAAQSNVLIGGGGLGVGYAGQVIGGTGIQEITCQKCGHLHRFPDTKPVKFCSNCGHKFN